MCTPKDVLDPSVDGQISYLCGRHDCSLLHFGDPVIGTVYDDRILVSSGQWWPLPRGDPTWHRRIESHGGCAVIECRLHPDILGPVGETHPEREPIRESIGRLQRVDLDVTFKVHDAAAKGGRTRRQVKGGFHEP